MSAVRVRLSPARDPSQYNGILLYEIIQIRSGSLIYDFSFIDVDKILPFSSTLGWHSLERRGSNEEGLTVDT
jgi:hypothetical protein